MRSLYWKIFISFWVSLLLFSGVSFWLTSHYLDSIRAETQQNSPRFSYMRYRMQLEKLAELQSLPALREWLETLDRTEAVPYLLLDETGKDMLNRTVPLRLQQRISRYDQRWQQEMQGESEHDDHHEHHDYREHPRRMHTVPILIGAHRYWLFADYQGINLGRLLQRPRVILIPILVALLISGIVCYLLARYLTWPITRLRLAAQDISSGHLDARVRPLLGKRQDELADLASDFDHMAGRLQLLLNSHKQLLSDASHELRSPLARLQVALGIAQQRHSHQPDSELQRIELEAERLNDLIGQLLSLSRLDNLQNLDTERLELDELLTSIVDDARYEAQAQHCHVILKNNPPVTLLANTGLLNSALENVMRNALRYTPQDGDIEISVLAGQRSGMIQIDICDQGPGIPQALLESVFDPFVRVAKARDRQSGGYGLGLAIARRAIELHGGQISATNRATGGLCVTILLPVLD